MPRVRARAAHVARPTAVAAKRERAPPRGRNP